MCKEKSNNTKCTPAVKARDCVWLGEEGVGVFGVQPPKGASLWIVDFFYIKEGEGSLELGPPGKYARCFYKNKYVDVSVNKLTPVRIGQWIRIVLDDGITHTGRITGLREENYLMDIDHIKPPLRCGSRISMLGPGDWMSLVDEEEAKRLEENKDVEQARD